MAGARARLRDEPVGPDRSRSACGPRAPGSFFAFLSPLIGWLGVAVTGSDTSSNALFGALQVTAAKDAGMDQTLLAAANSSGGVLGKMISPQNLAIGAAAVGMAGQEGDLFRKVLKWSLLLILADVRARVPAIDSGAGLDGRVVANGSLLDRLRGIVGERARRHPRAPARHLRVGRAAPVRGHIRRRSCCPGSAEEVAGRGARLPRGRGARGWRAAPAPGLSGGALPVEDGVLIALSRLRRDPRGGHRRTGACWWSRA